MNTTEPRIVRVEAVADLPVLWATFQRLDLPAILDRHFPTPLHWKGPLTPGEVLAVWLLFLVSQGDHCLNHVQPWVAQPPGHPLRPSGASMSGPPTPTTTGSPIGSTRLGAGAAFGALERDLSQQTIRVYELPTDLVRIDTTTAQLLRRGPLRAGTFASSATARTTPTDPQLKIAAAILDPLGLPLATAVVPGNTADDPLYIPAIQAVQQSLGVGGRTYVGDCKMAALATRAFVAAGRRLLLVPARGDATQPGRAAGVVADGLGRRPGAGAGVATRPQGASRRTGGGGFCGGPAVNRVGGGEGGAVDGTPLVVRSQAYAQSQEAALEHRLATAMAALVELPARKQGKKPLFHAELVQAGGRNRDA